MTQNRRRIRSQLRKQCEVENKKVGYKKYFVKGVHIAKQTLKEAMERKC